MLKRARIALSFIIFVIVFLYEGNNYILPMINNEEPSGRSIGYLLSLIGIIYFLYLCQFIPAVYCRDELALPDKIYAFDDTEEYFKKAKELIEKEDYDRAVTQLAKILEKSRDNIDARIMIAKIRFSQSNYEDAFDQVREILKLDSKHKETQELGNKIFLEAIGNRDFNAYRNFLFYTCNYVFGSSRPEVARFIVFLLKEHPEKIINEFNQINNKGTLTIQVLSSIYSSFSEAIPALTKYFIYKDIDGNYPARIAIKNIQEEELIRKNPDLLKPKKK